MIGEKEGAHQYIWRAAELFIAFGVKGPADRHCK
jgi:hypothetical protein